MVVGAGAVGKVITRQLALDSRTKEVVLADLFKPQLELPEPALEKVSTCAIDASRPGELRTYLKGIDVVINSASPKLNIPIMNAAYEARVHYIDLAEGEVDQFQFNQKWRDADLTAILGLGEDPGISNILARYAADRLDVVDRISIRDGEIAECDEWPLVFLFSPDVFLQEIFEPPEVYEKGEYRRLSPLTGEEVYNFPEPVGPLTVYPLYHEEVATLPRFLNKGAKNVDFKLALSKETALLLKQLNKLGLLSSEPITVGEMKVAPKDLLLRLIPAPSTIAGRVSGHATVVVEVEGEKSEQRIKYTFHLFMPHQDAYKKCGQSATAYLTGTPPAVGALMLSGGAIKERGTIPPEVLEPEGILGELERKEIRPKLSKLVSEDPWIN